MGTRGPAPKPSALRLIQGNLSKGKVKPSRREPQPSVAAVVLVPPTWMDPLACSVFLRLRPELPWLTVVDIDLLAVYCSAFSRWRQAEDQITQEGLSFATEKGYVMQSPSVSIARSYFAQMMTTGAALGLSPSARTRIRIEPEKPKQESTEEQMFG
jgi:P27 family predicted phage terminase small subunit